MNSPNKFEKPGSFLPNVKRYRDKSPIIHSRAVNYRHDGSGNGGYQNTGKIMEFREAFKSQLRSYERNNSYLNSRKSSLLKKSLIHATVYNQKMMDQEMNNAVANASNENYKTENNNNISFIAEKKQSSLAASPRIGNDNSIYITPQKASILQNDSVQLQQPPIYTQVFGSSRNSIGLTAAAQLLPDNPSFNHVRQLNFYQRLMNHRLSQPKLPKLEDNTNNSPNRNSNSTNASSFQKARSSIGKIKLRKIDQDQRNSIFKDYYEKSMNSSQIMGSLKKQSRLDNFNNKTLSLNASQLIRKE